MARPLDGLLIVTRLKSTVVFAVPSELRSLSPIVRMFVLSIDDHGPSETQL